MGADGKLEKTENLSPQFGAEISFSNSESHQLFSNTFNQICPNLFCGAEQISPAAAFSICQQNTKIFEKIQNEPQNLTPDDKKNFENLAREIQQIKLDERKIQLAEFAEKNGLFKNQNKNEVLQILAEFDQNFRAKNLSIEKIPIEILQQKIAEKLEKFHLKKLKIENNAHIKNLKEKFENDKITKFDYLQKLIELGENSKNEIPKKFLHEWKKIQHVLEIATENENEKEISQQIFSATETDFFAENSAQKFSGEILKNENISEKTKNKIRQFLGSPRTGTELIQKTRAAGGEKIFLQNGASAHFENSNSEKIILQPATENSAPIEIPIDIFEDGDRMRQIVNCVQIREILQNLKLEFLLGDTENFGPPTETQIQNAALVRMLAIPSSEDGELLKIDDLQYFQKTIAVFENEENFLQEIKIFDESGEINFQNFCFFLNFIGENKFAGNADDADSKKNYFENLEKYIAKNSAEKNLDSEMDAEIDAIFTT